MKLLEAETKLIYVIHFLLSKYMYIFVESQVIAHDVKPGSVIFVVYYDLRMVNVYIYSSLLRVLFTSVDILLTLV
jgi:hypothetical protein